MVFERHEYRSAIKLLLDALLMVHEWEIESEGVHCSPSVDVLLANTLLGVRPSDSGAWARETVRSRETLASVRSWLIDLGVSPESFSAFHDLGLGDAPAVKPFAPPPRASCRRCAEFSALLPKDASDEDRQKVDEFLGTLPHSPDCNAAPTSSYRVVASGSCPFKLPRDAIETTPERGSS